MIKDIIKLAREFETFMSENYEDFNGLERILQNKEDFMEGCVCKAGQELTIRTKLKEAISDFESEYGVVI